MKPLKSIINMRNKPLYIGSTIYILVSIILGILMRNGLVLFLGWNMFLATIPLVLSELLVHKKSKFLRLGIAFLFIIFFPNTIYIMTDFIHFQNYTFFTEYPNIYAFFINDWIVFTHLVIGAIIASKIGIIALQIMMIHYAQIKKIYKVLGMNILFILSSAAIFIGRFLRFNSWEVFKINLILDNVFQHFQFFIQFVMLSFIMHWVIYFVFHEKKEPMAQIK